MSSGSIFINFDSILTYFKLVKMSKFEIITIFENDTIFYELV